MDSFAQPTPNYHLSASTGLSTSGSSVTTWDSQQGSYSATQSNNSRRPVLEADGINGQPALAFDGSNDYLLLPDQNGFNTGGPFAAKTIAMVFETGSDITSRQMIYEQGGSTRGLNMSIHNGNLYLNGWNVNEDNWGPVDIHTPVATNTTYVAVLVFDASTIFGYVNGNLIGSAAVTGPLYNHGDDGALGGTVGSTKYYDNTNSRTYFQGKIAEWYSYNIALGDSDRSALEQTLSSRYQSLRLSIPMDLEGVNITSSQVDLSWTDTSDNETGFILERSTTSGSGFVVIDTANADENSYTDTGLASGTNYYYRAKTLYDGYNSDYTSELMITTHSRGPIAKSWDFDVSSEGWVGTGVLLNPTGTGVLNFSYNGYGSPRIQSPSNPGVNLNLNKVVRLRIKNNSPQTSLGFYFTTNTDPTIENVHKYTSIPISTGDTEFKEYVLDFWDNPKWSGMLGVIRIYVQGPGSLTGNIDVDYITIEDHSNASVPQAPSNLVASATTDRSISLSWQDESIDESGFILERKKDAGAYQRVTYLEADQTSYLDDQLESPGVYSYRLKSHNVAGDSEYSNETSTVSLSDGLIARSWDFDVSSEGWVGTGVLLNPTGTGVLNFSYNGYGSPRIQSPSNPGVNLNLNKVVRLRIKNNSPQTSLGFYFTTNTDPTIENVHKYTSIPISTGDTEFKEYVLDFWDNPKWSGMLGVIRIYVQGPGSLTGNIDVDYIVVENSPDFGQVIDQVELQALRDLYENTNGDNWTSQTDADPNNDWPRTAAEWEAVTSVDSTSVWYGISVTEGDITYLDLSSNNVSGTLPSSIGNLSQVEWFTVNSNNLTGTIPSEIGNFEKAVMINFAYNNLSGPIPSTVGNLTQVVDLRFHGNNLTGSVPEEIGNLSSIERLMLNDNQLSGTLPESLWTLTSLKYVLTLSSNQFTGQIPEEIGNLIDLKSFYIGNNNISGNLPASVASLLQLNNLSLNNNSISGAIPEGIVGLNDLTNFIAGGNSFTSFPDFSQHLNASNLNITIENNYIPQSDIDANLNPDNTHNFATFTYSPQNQIPADQGQVLDIAELQGLRDLYENTNGDNWTSQTDADPANDWPRTAAEWEAITELDQVVGWHGLIILNGDLDRIELQNNNLEGQISRSISDIDKLTYLDLSSNSLDGNLIPEIGELSSLTVLRLQYNSFSGSIPWQIGQLTGLTNLNLGYNQLSGIVPDSLRYLDNLTYLYLSFNSELEGEFPSAFCDMDKLQSIFLSGNKFTGTFPDCLLDLPSMFQIGITGNDFYGPLPENIGRNTNVRNLYLTNNDFSGKLPESLGNLNCFDLHLSQNNFTGKVPENVVGMTNLNRLYLSHNNFTSFPDFNGHPKLATLEVYVNENYVPEADINKNLVGGVAGGDPIFNIFNYSPQKIANGLVPDEAELQALRDLYESTNGDNWTSQTDADPANDWPRTDTEWEAVTTLDQVVETWSGITVQNGDVIKVILSSNNLTGTLPASIGNLQGLTHLWFNVNDISGELPLSIYSLENLIQLNLQGCDFNGDMQPNIASLSHLELLRIGGNSFNTPLPIEIGVLSNLWSLYINEIPFNSTMPQWIGQLSNLSELYASNCDFNGEIPSYVSDLRSIRLLYLGRNNFVGELPDLSTLTSLRLFNVELNDITGSLSDKFSTLLTELTQFDVLGNEFTDLPAFTSFSNPENIKVKAQANFLSFQAIESNLNPDGTIPLHSFIYSPQSSPTTTVAVEAFLNEAASVQNTRSGGANTLYQWQEWNGASWINVSGQTSENLSLPAIVLDDDGRRFRCEMTNTLVTGMTLYSEEYVIQVIIPQTFYVIANGNWSDPNIWSLTQGGASAAQVPTRYDDIRIGNYQIEVTDKVDCREVNITASNSTRLLVSGRDAKLTVNGEVIILNQGAVENKIVQVTNGGALECR